MEEDKKQKNDSKKIKILIKQVQNNRKENRGNSQFDMPEKGLYYASGWQSPITLWWVDPKKENNLIDARKNDRDLPDEQSIIDYWNRR